MDEQANAESSPGSGTGIAGLRRVLRIVLLFFALAVGGIVIAAWYAGDRSDLQMEYEGFD